MRKKMAQSKIDQLKKSKIGQLVVQEVGEENLQEMDTDTLIREQVPFNCGQCRCTILAVVRWS